MGYRGFGSFKGDMSMADDYSSGLEDVGLDLSSYPDVTPDEFADVTGGSSTVESPDFLSGGLTGASIMKFLGGAQSGGSALSQLSNFFGSGAAAGAASLAAPAAKAAARLMGKRLGLRGGRVTGGVRVGGRRMNPGNFKALRRSMRRLTAFERAARHVIHFTHPKPTARVKFKFHRRRRKR